MVVDTTGLAQQVALLARRIGTEIHNLRQTLMTTDTAQTVTGAKTFSDGTLLMNSPQATGAEPYSDANPPETLSRTVYPATSVVTPAAGHATDFTTDGKSLTLKAADGSFARVGFTAVKAATTASITLSGTQTIDGIAVVVGDRVLVKDQGGATNGVYDVAAGAWTRTAGLETAAGVANSDLITVTSGTVNGGTMWTTTFKGTDTLNSTSMLWYRVLDASQNATSRTTSAVTNATTTFSSTGLSIPVTAGKTYYFRGRGQYQSSTTTAGIGMNVGGTCAATAIRAELVMKGLTATTNGERSINSLNQNTASNATTAAATTDYSWSIEGEIRVLTAGTLQMNFRSFAAGTTITLQPDATFIVQEIP